VATACGLAFDKSHLWEQLKPDLLGELRNSKPGVYRLFRDDVRPIGDGKNGNEVVHRSAVTRVQRLQYRPRNLVRFLGAGWRATGIGAAYTEGSRHEPADQRRSRT